MHKTVASLFQALTNDAWRTEAGFSRDIEDANQELFRPDISEAASIEVLRQWIQKNQPCVFGRMAAKFDLINFCLLSESDLLLGDEQIHEKLQRARLRWLKQAFQGKTSNFIILVISPTVSKAKPDANVAELAQRLCSLYLEEDVNFDEIHLEQIFLEKPGSAGMTWKWFAGVNYFCAQGDKRWWQDHRIPGGLGFSVNSVGHFVKSEKISRAMIDLNNMLGVPDEEGWQDSKMDSLEKALVLAMQTISQASDTVSGSATELLPLSRRANDDGIPTCPTNLPNSLSDKDYCSYLGYYHTDYTLPTEYFDSEVKRPELIEPFLLDFTYLFHKHFNNPDHWTMGEGKRIRGDADFGIDSGISNVEVPKKSRATADFVEVNNCELLVRALSS